MKFSYQFQGRVLPSLAFRRDDMARVGQSALDAQRARLSQGLNVNDVPALPLSNSYRKQKARAGKSGVRDWNFSGQTLAGMRAQVDGDGKASVTFEGPAQKMASLVRWNATREQMAGLSPRDQERVAKTQFEILREKLTHHE